MIECSKGCDNSYEVNGKAYSHIVGVEIRGLYDGVAYWACPQCGAQWHRWSAPGRIRDSLAVTHPHLLDLGDTL